MISNVFALVSLVLNAAVISRLIVETATNSSPEKIVDRCDRHNVRQAPEVRLCWQRATQRFKLPKSHRFLHNRLTKELKTKQTESNVRRNWLPAPTNRAAKRDPATARLVIPRHMASSFRVKDVGKDRG